MHEVFAEPRKDQLAARLAGTTLLEHFAAARKMLVCAIHNKREPYHSLCPCRQNMSASQKKRCKCEQVHAEIHAEAPTHDSTRPTKQTHKHACKTLKETSTLCIRLTPQTYFRLSLV